MFPEKHFMERLFTPEIAQFYEKYYADKGITIKAGSLATEFEGKDGVVSLVPLLSLLLPLSTILSGPVAWKIPTVAEWFM